MTRTSKMLQVMLLMLFLKDSAANFYIIGHMANHPKAVDWAVDGGANAVEFDLRFDAAGTPTVVHHGKLCDCVCIILTGTTPGSVCELGRLPCVDSFSAVQLLQHIAAKHPTLPLLYVDSKTADLSAAAQKVAGQKVVELLVAELFNKGFKGKVVIASGKGRAYVTAAAEHAVTLPVASHIFFALDEDRGGVISNLKFLSSLKSKNVVYSTGVSACLPKTFFSEISLAARNQRAGSVSNVIIWSLDKFSAFENYYNAGVGGILTNRVRNLAKWATLKGIKLATVEDNALQATTSTTIIKSLGKCDCDYKLFKGCYIAKAAPQHTACLCVYKGLLRCGGVVVRCFDEKSALCEQPDRSKLSCALGGGNCGGY